MIVRLFFAFFLCFASAQASAQPVTRSISDPEVVGCLHGLGSAVSWYAAAMTNCGKIAKCRDLPNAYLFVLQKAKYLYDSSLARCALGIDAQIAFYADSTPVREKILTYAKRIDASPTAAQVVAKEVEEELRVLSGIKK